MHPTFFQRETASNKHSWKVQIYTNYRENQKGVLFIYLFFINLFIFLFYFILFYLEKSLEMIIFSAKIPHRIW